MSTDLPIVDIFTDGACKGNPGPGGWGASNSGSIVSSAAVT